MGWLGNYFNMNGPASFVEKLAANGFVFIASDADENDRVTGQTSFAVTTPTFLLDIPSGTTAVPVMVSLTQTGTVAGGAINMAFSIDNQLRYSAAGTDETNVLCARTNSTNRTRTCTLYSNPTATNANGVRIFPASMGADVDTAEGAVQGPYWTAELPLFLEGPAAFMIFTYAATTGPTWEWTIAWAEFPTLDIPTYAR